MSTLRASRPYMDNGYPTAARYPVPETDWHRILMVLLIDTLWEHFLSQNDVYVSGNLLIFHEPGNKRKHISPDVFLVRGVEKKRRPNYLVWEAGHAPEVVIELTSKTTRKNDLGKKLAIYRDVLAVKEYYLFDPFEDFLDPPMRGYRLQDGVYQPIPEVEGRLPSEVLGLHLEREEEWLRLWNPATGAWLPTMAEEREQLRDEVKALRRRLDESRQRRNGPAS